MNWAQHILIFSVRVYQRVISPALAGLAGPLGRCRFEPSCSQYAAEAVQAHGAVKGSALAAWRLCRCQPWGGCGHDPVPSAKFKVAGSKFKVFRGVLVKSSSVSSLQAVRGRGHAKAWTPNEGNGSLAAKVTFGGRS